MNMYQLLALLEETKRPAVIDTIKWLKPKSFYDDLAKLVAYICETPIALITVVAEHKQYFKGSYGVDTNESDRKDSICQYTLFNDSYEPLIINDILSDENFNDNELVKNDPKIRFYCGVPFKTKTGTNVGAICAIDKVERTITAAQVEHLQLLAKILESFIE